MQEDRRGFMKKAAIAGGVAAYGLIVATAVTRKQKPNFNDGVIIGESNKKEILYKESKAWEDYYAHAV